MKERVYLEDLSIYGKITLKCILKTYDDRKRNGLFCNRVQALVGCCGKCNKPSASTHLGKLFDKLRNCQCSRSTVIRGVNGELLVKRPIYVKHIM